jgi:hypothetical protein
MRADTYATCFREVDKLDGVDVMKPALVVIVSPEEVGPAAYQP